MQRRSPIPVEALLDHVAILATTGAGKTVVAKVVVEDAVEAGERVCVIDPMGVYYGLRTFADGKPAFPFVIFGVPDPRGVRPYDVEINAESGRALAQLIATRSFPSIICTAGMSVGARTRLFADFAETIIEENCDPLRLVIDECHRFMPQGMVADPMSGRMLHAANELVSGGRSRGFSLMLISQRASKVHKDSLTMCKTIVAMQMMHALDLKTVHDYVRPAAGKAKADEITGAQPGMQKGEGWIYSPQHKVLERVRFPMVRTLDTSDRPKPGEKRPALTKLKAGDLAELRAAFTAQTNEAAPERSPHGMPHGKKAASDATAKRVAPEETFTGAQLQAHGEQKYREGYGAGRQAERNDTRRLFGQAFAALPPIDRTGRDAPLAADARDEVLRGLEPIARRMLDCLERAPSGLTPKALAAALKVKAGDGRWYRNINALKTSGLAVDRGGKLVAPHAKGAANAN